MGVSALVMRRHDTPETTGGRRDTAVGTVMICFFEPKPIGSMYGIFTYISHVNESVKLGSPVNTNPSNDWNLVAGGAS